MNAEQSDKKVDAFLQFLDQAGSNTYNQKQKLHEFTNQVSKNIGSQVKHQIDNSLDSSTKQLQYQQDDDLLDDIQNSKLYQLYQSARNKIQQLKLELSEADQTISDLKERVKKQHGLFQQKVETVKQDSMNEKQELEKIIEQHLNMIDCLVKDKQVLMGQAEQAIDRMQQVEGHYEREMADMRRKFAREIKDVKEKTIAQERKDKNKWVDDKTKELRNLTIKALEPEMEKIMEQNRQEIVKLKASFEEQLQTQRQDMIAQNEQKCNKFMNHIVQEQDQRVEVERAEMRSLFQKRIDKMEADFQEQKQKLRESHERDCAKEKELRQEELNGYLQKVKHMQEQHLLEMRRVREKKQQDEEEDVGQRQLQDQYQNNYQKQNVVNQQISNASCVNEFLKESFLNQDLSNFKP